LEISFSQIVKFSQKEVFGANSNVMKCMIPYNLTFDISNFDYVTTIVMCRVRAHGKCIPKIGGLGSDGSQV
jgi:hypothetical protein